MGTLGRNYRLNSQRTFRLHSTGVKKEKKKNKDSIDSSSLSVPVSHIRVLELAQLNGMQPLLMMFTTPVLYCCNKSKFQL